MIRNWLTGSTGFIGSRLAEKLTETGSVRAIRHQRIPMFVVSCDRLFFLSTYGNMAHHEDVWAMVRANVRDPVGLLLGFNGWFCYMSSSSVLLPVQTPYSRTKRAAEEIIQSLPELKSCIVRPFSVTGVHEQKEHLIPTLIRSCMEGTEMTFDPSPTHDFVDVSDVCDALIRLADDNATGIFEFGNKMAISNEEVRRLVEEATGSKANITDVKPLRPYDNQDWCCKTTNEYWKPTKGLWQSITEMVAQYRNEHS